MRNSLPRRLITLLAVAGVGAAACSQAERSGDEQLNAALNTITADELAAHIKVLSSDEFEGRLPSTPGEEKTINYLKEQFAALGYEPANAGSWYQEVPLVSITADPIMSLRVSREGAGKEFLCCDQMVAWTKRVVDAVDLANSELVFVGYGSVAPEYEWNDYEGLDTRGKTVVMLVNDPGYATQDSALFNGRAMTYYGRWTYKYEEAARQGVDAAFVIHETAPAAYGWDVVKRGWTGPQFDMVPEDNNMSRAQVEGWLSLETARQIFAMAGQDFDQLKQQAAQRGFKPVPLGVKGSLSLRNTIERSTSNNVVAKLSGSAQPDEYIIYMGHWDHFGRDTTLEGDQIFNGALDNASGTAGLLEIAQAFAGLETRPSRSTLFLMTTAEEQGLLGSAYYAANPIYPLEKTVAAINIDVINHYGPMRDIVLVGYGNSELDDYLIAAAAEKDRVVVPDLEVEKGYFYRSDHFPLSKAGVPALNPDVGGDHLEHGAQWTQEKKDAWTAEQYHQTSDEYSPDWDLSGAVEDLRLLFTVGYRLSNETSFPNWQEGTEFKARRDAMMSGTH